MPSWFPTFTHPKEIVEEQGSTNGSLTWEVAGLGHTSVNTNVDNVIDYVNSNRYRHALFLASAADSDDSSLYLRVEVFPTAYPYKTAQYVTIYVNGVEVLPYCSPGIECGSDYFVCLADYDVSQQLMSANGGSLEVFVTSTGLSPSICDYNGYPLFVRFTLHDTNDPLTQAPSIYLEGSDEGDARLSSFHLSYQVKPGFMISLALWGLVGALFGAWASRFRASANNRDLLVFFKWYVV